METSAALYDDACVLYLAPLRNFLNTVGYETVDDTHKNAYALTYAKQGSTAMQAERHVRLFKNGRNQALRIPRDFELPGDEVIVRKEGDRLIVEPVKKPALLAVLSTLEPIDEDFPDVDEGLLPAEDVEL